MEKHAKEMRAKWSQRSRRVMLTRLQTLEREHRLAAVEAIEIGSLLRCRKNTPERKAIEEHLKKMREKEEENAKLGVAGRVLRWVGLRT
jgi:hypothetical protein